MASIENIAAAIRKEIISLEGNSSEKRNQIQDTYEKAVNAAALARKEALAKLDDDSSTLKKLKKLYKDTTGQAFVSDGEAVSGEQTKSTPAKDGSGSIKWPGKWEAVYSKLGITVADNVTLGKVKPTLFELYPETENIAYGTLNAAHKDFRSKNQ